MNYSDLAPRILELQPNASERDIARICLLLLNSLDSLDGLDADQLEEAWAEVALRLQAATDQHAAMTEELESLARSDPQKFSPEQVWILIRAIKVQSQVLRLYVGETCMDEEEAETQE